jgi:diadenosine tetraphosphatase ApaH/serine/threonine PP2A family protein phosphatase
MRIAVLADVHSNLEALEACLAHARAQGADRFAFLGDLVGYGADPEAVVERVRELHALGAIVVKGNHDEGVDGPASYFNDAARQALDWTRTRLAPAQRAFLAGLPLVAREDALFFVHASARAPGRWPYIDGAPAARDCFAAETGATWLFAGHTHSHRLYAQIAGGRVSSFMPVDNTRIPVGRHRRWLCVAGTVGQPRDGNPDAAYALFDADAETIAYHRVAYDTVRAAGKIRAAGLPAVLAWRIEKGA